MGLTGCFVIENTFTGLAPGPWRGVLLLDGKLPPGAKLQDPFNLKIEEVSSGELPFNFEVIYRDDESFYIEIINGEERIKVEDITMGLDKRMAKDTITIDFPVFESYIQGVYSVDVIQGEWVVTNRGEDYRIPFIAKYGVDYRFTPLQKEPLMDVSGRWEVTFEANSEEEAYKAIGEFNQEGNELRGTFMTETGDYRFLEGTIQENKLYLSAFDASHAFLFEAKINEDSTMIGSFRSGNHYKAIWTAKRNPNFELRDPDQLTYLKEGFETIDFTFENPEGGVVSLSDPAYQDKVKLVQLLGTWCPNCRDETQFLVNYLKENKPSDLAVIALAYERHKDAEKSKNAIRKYRQRMGVDYPVLYAGNYNKEVAAKTLPMLNKIISYPTLIFIDKKNKVRRIHTGFNGPATSGYKDFVKTFEETVKTLIAE
ncbi:MAG: hypothetical protein DHS20C18_36020 [Saprospiraceae bacterium]|nr:MAG: hypothetical protein DHS20C18_36020 [Saprospiraceae bacterium]